MFEWRNGGGRAADQRTRGRCRTYGAWTFFGIIPSPYGLGYFSAAPTALGIREVERAGGGARVRKGTGRTKMPFDCAQDKPALRTAMANRGG
ncbi:MAG TPA: hypothetical protein VHN10_12235, partial [Candidatus Acidoferrales bacterium]|nr:hypothetical protein [Candidatus Acidoferrales bacterium]